MTRREFASIAGLRFETELERISEARQAVIRGDISNRNATFFEQEANKLDGWSDDLKVGLEREIKELDRQIREAKRAATLAGTLDAKLEGQKVVRKLETERSSKRRSLFEAQDEIDKKRELLIEEIEGKLKQDVTVTPLFSVRWRLR